MELKANVISPIVHRYAALDLANNSQNNNYNKLNASFAIESALPFLIFFISYHPYYYYYYCSNTYYSYSHENSSNNDSN